MPTPSIAAISCLRQTGVFSDFPPPQNASKFFRYNLIYGFNGSGKTTLSRLFEAVREGGDRSNLADTAECTFELSDGSVITLGTELAANPIASKIAVFNEDFVEACLTWKSGSAKPIVYLGTQQAETAKTIDDLQTHVHALKQCRPRRPRYPRRSQ